MRRFGHLEIRMKDFHTSCTDCSHTSKCNLKLRRLQPLSVSVYRLHAFPSALGFIPCSLSGLHFYGPQNFFFFFFFENRMKEKKKKSLRIGLLGLSAPASSYFLFSFPLSLSLHSHPGHRSFSSIKPCHRLRARVRRP